MEHNVVHLPIYAVIPFVIMLGAIAVFPLWEKTKHLWHHNWFQLVVALVIGVPVTVWMLFLHQDHAVIHALVEYGQFIILLGSLFYISGGIFLSGDIEATPRNNSIFLGIGAVLASLIGTTGAAMLMIRPILNTNKERHKKAHTVIFAIFLIANCGGLLLPQGDPPLFLGFLRGVPYLWTLNLLPQWLFVNGLILFSYYLLDKYEYHLESKTSIRKDKEYIEPLKLKGGINLLFLLGVVVALAFLPSVNMEHIFEGKASLVDFMPIREVAMLSMIVFSMLIGPESARKNNEFEMGPIKEVAALFIGIFTAMVPALIVLKQLAPSLPLNEITFFVFTGGLSSVLDNAPTYVTFFEMARELGGSPAVAGVFVPFLTSISLGAVFLGSMTYIGNGPNFMVKSIAEAMKVEMPSFGGYIIWSAKYLLPIFGLLVLTFIVPDKTINLIGIVVSFIFILWKIYLFKTYKKRLTDDNLTPPSFL